MAFDGRALGGISVLAAVVETGNFVRAAEALGLTQSGVSRAVARLEARVGVRLFDRTPRAVSLTDEGRRFHAQVRHTAGGLLLVAESCRNQPQIRTRRTRQPWPSQKRCVTHSQAGGERNAVP